MPAFPFYCARMPILDPWFTLGSPNRGSGKILAGVLSSEAQPADETPGPKTEGSTQPLFAKDMTMNNSSPSLPGPLFLALLGGATLGAIAMALTTPKTGREVRTALGALGDPFRAKAAEDLEDEEILAMFI
jgi:hypothetical protein